MTPKRIKVTTTINGKETFLGIDKKINEDMKSIILQKQIIKENDFEEIKGDFETYNGDIFYIDGKYYKKVVK